MLWSGFCLFKKKKKISPILKRNSNGFNGSVFSTYPFTNYAVGPTVSSPCETEKKGMLLCVSKNFLKNGFFNIIFLFTVSSMRSRTLFFVEISLLYNGFKP